jgi:general secretion pathway protein J
MRGFTLLEMAVVLALLAMMSIIIIEGLRFGGRAYTEVATVDDDEWQLFAAQRFLRAVLESAQPFKPERADGMAYGLEGTATGAAVSASRSRLRGPGALTRYELFLAADRAHSQRRNLMVRARIDRDGHAEPQESREDGDVLIENVSRIEWSYFDAPCKAPATWHDEWQGRRELPALVRVRIVFPPGDSRHWPDLIVAPRVTDDFIFSLYDDGTRACDG